MCGNSIQECLNCKKPECDNDRVKKLQELDKEQVERRKAWTRARRQRWRDASLCTSCGKRPPRDGYAMCRVCQIKFSKYKNEENYRRGTKPKSLLDGITICKKCGKDVPMDGYKVCRRCYESNMANLRRTPTHRGIKRSDDKFREGVDLFWRSSSSQKRE